MALDKLQKLQNRASTIITNSPYNASALPIIRKLGWQTLNDLIVTETLKMIYKCTNDEAEAPSYLACLLDRLSETITQELRNIYVSRFYEQHVATNACLFREVKLWNGLDAKSRFTSNFKQFKSYLENSRKKGIVFIPDDRSSTIITFTLL